MRVLFIFQAPFMRIGVDLAVDIPAGVNAIGVPAELRLRFGREFDGTGSWTSVVKVEPHEMGRAERAR
jgi:hypothetical protein